MKTITISVQPNWVNEERQRELELSLANDAFIGDFVFNEDGDLEVTMPENENPAFVMNLCFLKIQYAIRASALY